MKLVSPIIKKFPEYPKDYDRSKQRNFITWTKMTDVHGNKFSYQGEIDDKERPDGKGIDIAERKDGTK